MRKFIIDKETKVVKFEVAIAYEPADNEILVETDDLSGLNFPEVIQEVPATISRLNLKIELLKRGITTETIQGVLAKIPESAMPKLQKEIIMLKFGEAEIFHRNNPELIAIAKVLGQDIDSIFINGNKMEL